MSTSTRSDRAFTLVEVMAVTAIVSLLAMILLPALNRTGAHARRIKCMANLRQAGIGFQSFLHDHNDQFPMGVSTNSGGTMETAISGYSVESSFYFSYTHFQALSNDLSSPKILACPSDPARNPAEDFAALNNRGVSYFIGANADCQLPNSLLAGDRNITPLGGDSPRTLVRLFNDTSVRWTGELHTMKGNELFADGHVERANSIVLRMPRRNAPAVMDLMLPSVRAGANVPAALASVSAPPAR